MKSRVHERTNRPNAMKTIPPCTLHSPSTCCKTTSPNHEWRKERARMGFLRFESPDTACGRRSRSSRTAAARSHDRCGDTSNPHRPSTRARCTSGSPSCPAPGASPTGTAPPLPPIALACAGEPAIHIPQTYLLRSKRPDGSEAHARNPSARRRARAAWCLYR